LGFRSRRVTAAILLALLLLSPSVRAKPIYSVTYVNAQPSESHLVCKYNGVRVLYVKGEQVSGRLAFKGVRVPPEELCCELYVGGAYVSESTAVTYLEVERPSLIGLLFLVLVIAIGGIAVALARRAWWGGGRPTPTPPPYTGERGGWGTYRYERPMAERKTRRPLPVTVLAIIDISLGAVGLLLGLVGIVGLLGPLGGTGLGGIIALGLVLALAMLGSSAGVILLLKGVLLWRGSKWGFWMSIALMVVTALTALVGVYPLLIYSAANLLVLLPSSREYLLGAERRKELPYEVYEL